LAGIVFRYVFFSFRRVFATISGRTSRVMMAGAVSSLEIQWTMMAALHKWAIRRQIPPQQLAREQALSFFSHEDLGAVSTREMKHPSQTTRVHIIARTKLDRCFRALKFNLLARRWNSGLPEEHNGNDSEVLTLSLPMSRSRPSLRTLYQTRSYTCPIVQRPRDNAAAASQFLQALRFLPENPDTEALNMARPLFSAHKNLAGVEYTATERRSSYRTTRWEK